MQARVYLLRQRGRRLPDRHDESFTGRLVVDATQNGHAIYTAARLCRTALRGSRQDELVPPLYEPVLAAVGDGVLLLRGFESRDGVGYVQEWRCVLELAGAAR